MPALLLAVATMSCGSRTELPTPEPSPPPCYADEIVEPDFSSCATDAIADQTFATSAWATGCGGTVCDFQIDTGLSPYAAVGARYGQPACPSQYVVEASLEGLEDFQIDAFAGWSLADDANPAASAGVCDAYSATMTLWGYDGSWTMFDEVQYTGAPSQDSQGNAECVPVVRSSLQGETGNTVSPVPTARFTKLRVAVAAFSCVTPLTLPVDLLVTAVAP